MGTTKLRVSSCMVKGNKSEDLLKAMGLLRVENLVSIVEVDLVNALVS